MSDQQRPHRADDHLPIGAEVLGVITISVFDLGDLQCMACHTEGLRIEHVAAVLAAAAEHVEQQARGERAKLN